jgi:serine/threonine-protein kinase
MTRLIAALLVGAWLASADVARAQPQPRPEAPEDTAASEALFYEGRNLMTQHRYAEACAVFERAEKVHVTIGVLLNLADCYEQSGRTASAWSKFHEAALAARQASDPREGFAKTRIASLEPRLVTITIDASKLREVRDANLRLGGKLLDASQWGTAIPVDPGSQTVEVRAPGKQPWSATPHVTASMTLNVPLLKDSSAAALPVQSNKAATVETEAPPPEQASVDRGGGLDPHRTWALAAGGVGAVGLGVGSVFGLISLSKHNDAAKHCANGDNPCDGQGVQWGGEAQSAGNVSTIAFVVGAAALAGGAVLWLTAPVPQSAQLALVPSVGPESGGLSVKGLW